MAIAPLQLPSSQAITPTIDWAPLGKLGEVYKKALNEKKLSDLGKGLADGTIDYRNAAGQVADMGDVQHTLQFLALAEQQKKQADELAASREFNGGLSNLYGANPTPSAPLPSAAPVPGARPAPVATALPAAGAAVPSGSDIVVPSSSRVMGDAEGVASGLYDPPAAPGLRPPVQMADAGPRATPSAMPAPSAAPAAAEPAVAPLPPAGPVAPPPAAQSATLPPISPRALALIAASGNPRLPQAQRETAKVLLTSELDNSKATSDMKEWAFSKAQDPNTPDYTTWHRANKAAGRTQVTIDQKGETKFAEAAGGTLAKRFEKLSEEGQSATQDLALVGQLRDLGAVVKTGAPAAIQGWLAERGIKVGENVGAVEAYGSIIDKLTPQQRVPGSGTTSDKDASMFKNSLPKLINTPDGNSIVTDTLAALAQYRIDRATIAERALTKELTPAEALKEMRELPNPYSKFQEFAKTGFRADPNNPASAAPPTSKPVKTLSFTRPEIDQSLSNARAAISANPAARDAIIKKLKDSGLDPSGL